MHDAIADEFLTPLVVNSVQFAADGVRLFELRHQTGLTLPPFAPGAHIPVMTPAGLRRYSLCNDPHETERYEIAVKREPAGRGGSRSMVDEVRVGDILPVGVPRNEFELHPRAKRFLFIAGGIGVTPIISMMRYLKRTQAAPFRLLYLTRDEANAPFLDVLSTTDFAPITTVHYDYGEPARSYDLWPI
ncbi:MAG: ferredoxin reductase, partial [Burkholderiales bacterium]|nr:ferredoxin reductase [Burkholderiales bacterium]